MRYVHVAGVDVSVIGVGTWQFASRDWGYGADYADREADRIINRALDLGVNLIDTAEASRSENPNVLSAGRWDHGEGRRSSPQRSRRSPPCHR